MLKQGSAVFIFKTFKPDIEFTTADWLRCCQDGR